MTIKMKTITVFHSKIQPIKLLFCLGLIKNLGSFLQSLVPVSVEMEQIKSNLAYRKIIYKNNTRSSIVFPEKFRFLNL